MTALFGQLLMVFGAALLAVAMVGVLRLPSAGAWVRLALLVVALWVTLPVASHALARAAISRLAKTARSR
jgi:multisubunit Na+/H+ antiporter MnhG subunit